MNAKTRFAVLGAGSFGRLFARLLKAAGHAVDGIDIDNSAAPLFDRFERLDLQTSEAPPALLAQADVALVCLPDEVALAAASRLLSALRPNALWVDILSVKSEIAPLLRKARSDVETLSLSPLFAPSAGFAAQFILSVSERGGDRTRQFLHFLEGLGAQVTATSAEQHDRLMAGIQVVTHASLLAFAGALSELGGVPAKAGAEAVAETAAATTPPHRALLAATARMISATPRVYWDIQRRNPFGEMAREALCRAAQQVQKLVAAGDEPGFAALFEDARRLYGPTLEPYAQFFAERLTTPPQWQQRGAVPPP